MQKKDSSREVQADAGDIEMLLRPAKSRACCGLGTRAIAGRRGAQGNAKVDPREAEIVELRFFGGLTVEETAAALGVSVETVMRDWRLAKPWLLREISRGNRNGS
jgi:DNA-directed RNA polymerase specialized sigma24 family protein